MAALADYALHLLSDESLLRQMGEAARRRAAERFESELMVPQYEAFYRRVLAG